mmetsp:Transcript_97819/g.273858  ORF Transcript_97819/g.273858 Transcript_97819/m.273858 type:complete len:305 (+) Transcript_97819:99-1013(+)
MLRHINAGQKRQLAPSPRARPRSKVGRVGLGVVARVARRQHGGRRLELFLAQGPGHVLRHHPLDAERIGYLHRAGGDPVALGLRVRGEHGDNLGVHPRLAVVRLHEALLPQLEGQVGVLPEAPRRDGRHRPSCTGGGRRRPWSARHDESFAALRGRRQLHPVAHLLGAQRGGLHVTGVVEVEECGVYAIDCGVGRHRLDGVPRCGRESHVGLRRRHHDLPHDGRHRGVAHVGQVHRTGRPVGGGGGVAHGCGACGPLQVRRTHRNHAVLSHRRRIHDDRRRQCDAAGHPPPTLASVVRRVIAAP